MISSRSMFLRFKGREECQATLVPTIISAVRDYFYKICSEALVVL